MTDAARPPRISDLARATGPNAGNSAGNGAAPAPYLDGLNPEQRSAVEALDGPVLVLAGAGTGKTRVLTTRLAHIIATQRAWPSQILAVTFTNKAAREMRERVGALVGSAVEGMPWLGTFHAIGAQILRRHAELAGLRSSFTILDTDDQVRLMKQIIQAEGLDEKRWTARHFATVVDGWKNRGLTPDLLSSDDAFTFADGKAVELYTTYQERLAALNAVDFGDLLLANIKIFKDNRDVLESYHRKFRYILVDEYQDTNTAQYLWLRLLAQGGSNICVVGDDDQAIYGWRGADVDNILRFEKDFPGATVVRLERNYRSTAPILAAASGLISANGSRLGKTLWTDAQGGDPVEVCGVWDGDAEARLISDRLEAWKASGRAYGDAAILVRASWQMRAFEDRFIMTGIPYRVVGGPRFFERAEIRDAHAYLRLIRSSRDDLAFERIVNTPKRGVGDTSLQRLQVAARAAGRSLADTAAAMVQTDEIRGPGRTGLRAFLHDIERWRDASSEMSHTDLAERVLDESGYTQMWRNDKSPQAAGRLDNLKELIHAMGQFDTLEAYLEHVSLVMDVDTSQDDDQAWLMTLHAAKGLEFPLVFLPGWEETVFPSQRALDEGGLASLEEERRLGYVGLTRAREHAVITFAANRQIFGRWQSVLPSRFVDELPPDQVRAQADTGYFGVGATGDAHAVGHLADAGQSSYESPGWRRFQAAKDQPRRAPPTIEASGVLVAKDDASGGVAVGERVFHIKFGYGRVELVEGNKVTVAFEKAGRKRVIDSFLERP